MPGRGAFERCVESVSERGGAYSPRGVCAAAGRRKYGKKKFQAMAAAGRRKASRHNVKTRSEDLTRLPATKEYPTELWVPTALLKPGGKTRRNFDPLSLTYTGQVLERIEKEREKLQRQLDREAKRNQKMPKTIWSKGTIWKKRPKSKPNGRRRNSSVGREEAKLYRKWEALVHRAARPKSESERLRLVAEIKRVEKQMEAASKRGNPRNPVDAAQSRYESFHGRPSSELIDIHTPMHEHSVLSGLGELVKLVVIAADGTKVTIKNFGVDSHGKPCILSQNEEATQLFIDGGDQSVELSEFGIHEPYHEMETLGRVRNVYYFTTKDHLGDQGGTATYNHKFGGLREVRLRSGRTQRKRSPLPDLIYDTRNKLLYFSGGGYSLPDEGIDG